MTEEMSKGVLREIYVVEYEDHTVGVNYENIETVGMGTALLHAAIEAMWKRSEWIQIEGFAEFTEMVRENLFVAQMTVLESFLKKMDIAEVQYELSKRLLELSNSRKK